MKKAAQRKTATKKSYYQEMIVKPAQRLLDILLGPADGPVPPKSRARKTNGR